MPHTAHRWPASIKTEREISAGIAGLLPLMVSSPIQCYGDTNAPMLIRHALPHEVLEDREIEGPDSHLV
jgi:hypothetical protein